MVPKCCVLESWSESSKIIERFNDKNNMDPIYHDFKIQVLSALTGSPIVQCCPCQDPDCPLSPMTVSDINTQSVASPPAAAPTLPTCSPCPPTPEWTPEQCPPPAPATTPDPTTSSRLECLGSNPDYNTSAPSKCNLHFTGVAINTALNKCNSLKSTEVTMSEQEWNCYK